MALRTEPRIYTETHQLGDLEVKFEGEQWDREILDTRVTINGVTLCWIVWENREAFLDALQAVIQLYRI